MLVRKFKPKDLKEVATIFKDGSNSPPYDEKWTDKSATEKIKEYFKSGIIFVVEQDNKVVGFVTGFINTYYAGKDGFIKDIFVDPEYQHKGFGKALISEIELYFKKQGVNCVNLRSNAKAKVSKFYSKLGFKKGSIMIGWYKDI